MTYLQMTADRNYLYTDSRFELQEVVEVEGDHTLNSQIYSLVRIIERHCEQVFAYSIDPGVSMQSLYEADPLISCKKF